MKSVLAALAVVSSAAAFTSSASAGTYFVDETVSRYVACYNKVYVPARVLVNTKGQLVRGEDNSWEITPTSWNRVRDPAVYIQTRKTVERDHYSLVKTGCP